MFVKVNNTKKWDLIRRWYGLNTFSEPIRNEYSTNHTKDNG